MNTETTLPPVAQAEIIPPGSGPDIETMERGDSLAIWNGYRESLEKLKASADAALSADPNAPSSSKLARAARLELRQIRLAVEAKRKEIGEYHLLKTQGINAAAKELKELIEPYEEKLLEVEQHAERMEAERVRKLTAERVEAISKFTTPSSAIDYGAMPEEEFAQLISDAKALYELRQAKAKRAEEIRIANEKALAEERERIRIENERLKKEAAERENAARIEREKAEVARIAAETKARQEREAIEAKARAEREEVERKAKAAREAAEAVAAKERAAREKLESEKRQREEREAKERQAAERAAKKAAAAPDGKKIAAYIISLQSVEAPEMSSMEGKSALSQIKYVLDGAWQRIQSIREELGK